MLQRCASYSDNAHICSPYVNIKIENYCNNIRVNNSFAIIDSSLFKKPLELVEY